MVASRITGTRSRTWMSRMAAGSRPANGLVREEAGDDMGEREEEAAAQRGGRGGWEGVAAAWGGSGERRRGGGRG